MNREPPIAVRVSRRVTAPPERVFDAFLDPHLAGRFMFATPAGGMVQVEIDPRVGGSFRFVDRRDGQDVVHEGRYLEIDRPRRLVFSFSVAGFVTDPDRITIEIRPTDAGSEVALTHEMKPEWSEYAGRTEAGWSMILAGLEAAISEAGVRVGS
jgi:uncharacterized protein YndB with AHSA1/START domain